MAEMAEIKSATNPHEILLVADSLTGQDAVNLAKNFNDRVGITGIVLTRVDGDGPVSYTHLDVYKRQLLPVVLDSMLKLTEEGWRKLTFRWGLFFFLLAAINEVVWRTQTTDFWVSFKVFGTMPLTLIFAFSQVPLIMKHELKGEEAENAPEHF